MGYLFREGEYPCDNGGNCPYDAQYENDCEFHCGLGVYFEEPDNYDEGY